MTDENLRAKFLNRISTVGTGLREDIQMALGAAVVDLREQIIGGIYGDDEMDAVVAFHDAVEELWRMTLSTRAPLEPAVMVARLERLRGQCTGPLGGYGLRIDGALAKATALKKVKELK